MKEIKPPSADIVKLRSTGKRHFMQDKDDLSLIRNDLLSLANRIENIKLQTDWPDWSQNQADSMREFANQLKKD